MSEVKIFKILTHEQWQLSRIGDEVILTDADEDFIHLCEAHQIEGVVERYFTEHSEVLVAQVDADLLPGRLVLESNKPGGEAFYHLYNGRIPIKSITKLDVWPKI